MIDEVMFSVICLTIALIGTAIGQLFFKMHYQHTGKIFLFSALGTFAMVPVFSYLALLNLSLAVVYMSTALTSVLVLVLSHFFLNERITKQHMMAMVFIVFGVLLFNT